MYIYDIHVSKQTQNQIKLIGFITSQYNETNLSLS